MNVIRALVGSAVVLASMAGCGGDESEGPDGVDIAEFCDAYFGLFSGRMTDIDPKASGPEQGAAMAEALRAWAAELQEIGTPEEMPDKARKGFDLVVSAATDLEPGDGEKLDALDDDFSEDERAATQAFETYATQNCESPFGDPLPD